MVSDGFGGGRGYPSTLVTSDFPKNRCLPTAYHWTSLCVVREALPASPTGRALATFVRRAAIGTFQIARLGKGTIAMNMCERHADLLKDRMLTMRVEEQ